MATPEPIGPDHPLHRMHTFENPLPGPIPAHSIEQLYAYVLALQSGRPDVAARMLDVSADQIFGTLESYDLGLSAVEVFAAKWIYRDIVIDQVSREGSPLRDEMLNFVAQVQQGDGDYRPYFIACNSARDRVWSAGLTVNKFEKQRQYNNLQIYDLPGCNVYGAFVLSGALSFLLGETQPKWGFDRLSSEICDLSDGDSRTKTVLCVTDSMGQYLKHIRGGKALRISGGIFSNIIDRVNAAQDLSEYRALIVHAGINVVQRSPNICDNEMHRFVRFLRDLRVREPDLLVMVSLAIPHEGSNPDGLWEFAQFGTNRLLYDIENFNSDLVRAIQEIGGIELCALGTQPPFWNNGRRVRDLYVETDDFHLNAKGTECLWKLWTRNTVLQEIPVKFGSYGYEEDVRPNKALDLMVVDDAFSSSDLENDLGGPPEGDEAAVFGPGQPEGNAAEAMEGENALGNDDEGEQPLDDDDDDSENWEDYVGPQLAEENEVELEYGNEPAADEHEPAEGNEVELEYDHDPAAEIGDIVAENAGNMGNFEEEIEEFAEFGLDEGEEFVVVDEYIDD